MSEKLFYAFSFCGLVISRGLDYSARILFGIYITCFEFFSAYTSKKDSSVVEIDDDKTDDNTEIDSDTDCDEVIEEKNNIPKAGDIIIFNLKRCKDVDSDDDLNDFTQPRRSISTYGKIPIEPNDRDENNETIKYIVTSVNSTIPNRKGSIGICYENEVSMGKTNKRHMHVYPVEEDDFKKDIFWYINYDDMTICQYEDGGVIDNIESIEIFQSNDVFKE